MEICLDICDEIVQLYYLHEYPVSIEENKCGQIEVELCPALFLVHGFQEIEWDVMYLPFVYKQVSVLCLQERK